MITKVNNPTVAMFRVQEDGACRGHHVALLDSGKLVWFNHDQAELMADIVAAKLTGGKVPACTSLFSVLTHMRRKNRGRIHKRRLGDKQGERREKRDEMRDLLASSLRRYRGSLTHHMRCELRALNKLTECKLIVQVPLLWWDILRPK